MHGRIGRNVTGLLCLGGHGPATFDDCGLGNPAAYHTTRPGEGRDGGTSRLTHARWCL